MWCNFKYISMNKEDLRETVEKFKEETGYLLEVRDNELFYDGNIFLSDKVITELPDNLTVNGNLVIYFGHIKKTHNKLKVYGNFELLCTQIESLPDNLIIGGTLTINGTLIKTLPDNLVVGCNLEIRKSNITNLPDNLVVGGNIDISYMNIPKIPNNFIISGKLKLYSNDNINLPENLTIGGDMVLSYGKITELPNGLTIGGNIDLSFSEINKLPDNLFVCGYLDITHTKIKKLPKKLVVYGELDMRYTPIKKLPKTLTVDGFLVKDILTKEDLSNIKIELSQKQKKIIHDLKNMTFFWKSHGVEYIKADGIFSVIVSHHGNIYNVHKIGEEDKPFYLVTDGENNWAHGATIAEAKADLIYKLSNRDTSDYEKLSLDDTLSYEEAIAAYRIITGACSVGTRYFIESRLPRPHKDKYTIREIIDLTADEYGSERFKFFFEK